MINEQSRINPDDEGRPLCGDETAGGQSPRSKVSTTPVLSWSLILGAPRPQRDRRGLVKRLLQAEHL
jgi:hypothetical protein